MSEITDLLKAWKSGDKQALEELMAQVEPELKRIARAYLRTEKPGNLLQTTALVNEALIRLLPEKISFSDRKHFYGFVARRMRQVLVDYAKKRKPTERLEDVAIADERSTELVLLDQALTKLAGINERQATIVECRYFLGLTRKEVAELFDLSETTIDRDWREARRWLKREMTGDAKQ